jgi:hypothetical protein
MLQMVQSQQLDAMESTTSGSSETGKIESKHVKELISQANYGKGEWCASYASLQAEVDCEETAGQAKKIARYELNKIGESVQSTSSAHKELREHLVSIVKDTWWSVFLIANVWTRFMCSVIARDIARAQEAGGRRGSSIGRGGRDSSSEKQEQKQQLQQQRLLLASRLEAPSLQSHEGAYLLSSFLLLRTTELGYEVPPSSNYTVRTVWAMVWMPMCLAYTKALMTGGLGELACEGSGDAAAEGASLIRQASPAGIGGSSGGGVFGKGKGRGNQQPRKQRRLSMVSMMKDKFNLVSPKAAATRKANASSRSMKKAETDDESESEYEDDEYETDDDEKEEAVLPYLPHRDTASNNNNIKRVKSMRRKKGDNSSKSLRRKSSTTFSPPVSSRSSGDTSDASSKKKSKKGSSRKSPTRQKSPKSSPQKRTRNATLGRESSLRRVISSIGLLRRKASSQKVVKGSDSASGSKKRNKLAPQPVPTSDSDISEYESSEEESSEEEEDDDDDDDDDDENDEGATPATPPKRKLNKNLGRQSSMHRVMSSIGLFRGKKGSKKDSSKRKNKLAPQKVPTSDDDSD